MNGPKTSDRNLIRPSAMPHTMPSTVPIANPISASSIVVQIWLPSEPIAVPSVIQDRNRS